jgi:deferrochelatase/peroxidase EfeB
MEEKRKHLQSVSNFATAQAKAKKYLGKDAILYISTRKDKKYMIEDPKTGKMVHFGHMDYEDFTKHKDKERRERYLKRATNIKGNWESNPYSPNNLSIHVLW